MKHPSSVRYFLLTGAAAAALLCSYSAIAATELQGADTFAVIKDWHISPVTDNKSRLPYCALSAKFANGVILTNTRNRDNKGSLAVEFPNVRFQADQQYRIDLKIGDNELTRSYAAKAVKENMIVIKISDDRELFDAFNKGKNITVLLEKGKAAFPLHGHEKSFFELDYCVKGLPIVAEAIEDEEPALKENLPAAAPSIPLENSVYTKKIAPPTLEEKYKNDKEKRVAATLKLKPIPVDEAAAAVDQVGEKTPATLKSGYTSTKKRIYEPATPNEDISDEERAASLKSTLEKARTKALAMAEGKTPEEAEAQVVETEITQVQTAVSAPLPPIAQIAENTTAVSPPVSSPAPQATRTEPKEPVTIPPVAFNKPHEQPIIAQAASPVKESPAPVYVTKEENRVVPPVSEPVEQEIPAAIPVLTEKEEVIIPPTAPQQPQITAAIAPVLPPAIHHTVDFTSLPQKTFSVTPWETELVTNKADKPYCLLTSSFDNGVKLFMSRSSYGLSTLGIDFGTDLLERGRLYQTTPAVENIYEQTFTAKAESPALLVVQLGKQDELFRAIQANGTFVVSIPGAIINFDTSSALQSAEAFDNCLDKINTALQASPIQAVQQPAVVQEIVSEPVAAPQQAQTPETGADKYRSPYVRTKQPEASAAANSPAAATVVPATAQTTTAVAAPAAVPTAEDVPLQEPAPIIVEEHKPEPAAPVQQTAPETFKSPIAQPDVSSAPTSLTEKPIAEPEPVIVPPVVPVEPAIETREESVIEPVEPELESDPSMAALNSLVERNRAELAESLRKKSLPQDTSRTKPQPRRFASAHDGAPVSYVRTGAPKTSDVIKARHLYADKAFTEKAASDIALIAENVSAPSGLSLYSGKHAYPVREILKASGTDVKLRATSQAKVSYEWLNEATGVKGELKIIPYVNSADNADYLLDLQDADASSCRENFSFELGAGNTYKTVSVMTADSICTDPLNASSSAYLLHFDGKALYRWRFSGETPAALMIERNRISDTINTDAENNR